MTIRPTDTKGFGVAGQVWFSLPGQPPVQLQPLEFVYTDAVVLIKIVPNLPDGPTPGQPTQWTVNLQATGATAPCSYPFVIDALPPGQLCPSLVRIADGVYGTAASPAIRSAPIFIEALAGYFGDATASSGTVTFSSPVFPNGFAAQGIQWQPQQVQFTPPSILPPTSSPTVWDVSLRATGAANACGPYKVVVEGAPLTAAPSVHVASIPNLPGRTDPRGQPVTLYALGGFFGGPTTSAGTVTLTRGATSLVVPADDVVWTPVSVTFLMPDLPDVQGTTVPEWDATLEPVGGTALGPYGLQVLPAEPLLISAPLFAISEERIDLAAIAIGGVDGSASNNEVISLLTYDEDGTPLFGGQFGPPPRARRTPTGVSATAPTVYALRQSPRCGPNQMVLDVTFKLQVSDSANNYQKISNASATPTRIVLPPPHIGRFSRSGNTLTLGRPPGTGGTTGPYRGCEWLGPQANGKVQLLEIPSPTPGSAAPPDENLAALNEALDALSLELPAAPSEILSAASPFPSSGLLNELDALKTENLNEGRRFLTVTNWSEETIEVELPSSIKAGTIVVWRDDLPSPPLPFVEPPTIQVPCAVDQLRPLLRQTFDPVSLPVPGGVVGVGASVPLQIDAIPGADNPLATLLGLPLDPPVGVTFSVTLKKNGSAPPQNSVLTSLNADVSGQEVALPVGQAVPLYLRPDLEAKTSTTAGDTGWRAEVKAVIHNLPGCPPVVEVTDFVAPIEFSVANLPVPCLVIGIRGREYKEEGWGVPPNGIVFSHPNTPMLGGMVADVKNGGQAAVIGARNTLFNEITQLKTLLGLVSRFAGLPGSPIPSLTNFDDSDPNNLTPLETALNTLSRASWSDLTFDGSRSFADLNGDGPLPDRDPWWKDRIWSVFMISAPAGPILELWESPGQTGKRLQLAMPPGNLIGGYWTLYSMYTDHTTIGDLPDPPGDVNQIAGMIDSFRWVDAAPVPSGPGASGSVMQPGTILAPDIRSADGRFLFVYQGDGNLVLYGPAGAMWASNTGGKPFGVCIMQGDGNLVIYGPSGQYVWDTGTHGSPGNWLVVQDDGNVVIYRPDGSPHWASNTSYP